ncbi:reverse transcriptase domain-containing protein [Tanacetum coccineum]
MSVRSQAPIPFPPEAEVAWLLAIPTTPPSPLTPLSSPLPQIPSPPLHVPSPPTSPTYAKAPLGYRAVGIQLGAASPLPLPPPSPPLLLPSTDRRADIPEVVLPPRKRLCIAPGPRFEVGESSSAAATRPTRGHRADYGFIGTLDAELRRDQVREMGYGITDVWEDLTEDTEEVPPTSVAELSQRVTDLVTTIRDRQYHLNTSMLVERHPHLFTGGTGYNIVSHTTSLQTQLIAALGRIDTLEARDPAHTNDPEDADSSSTALLQQKYTWSFVSTAFSSLIDITPTTLDHYYDVELANGKIIRINTIIRGCTLNFLNHPLNIDLMPVELGSFDVIIGMDWLAKYHAVIVCDEKLVCIPFGNETLIVRGDGSNRGNETRLNIILCTKTQKYMLKGCHVFLAHVTTKKTEDKSEEKRLEDVPIVRDFPEVFPDTSTLLISSVQDERVIGATARTIRQRFYKTQFLTLGSSGLVCQEEGWIISNVHRLPRTEQANGEESLSTLED